MKPIEIPNPRFKCVVVGSDKVGKTCLCMYLTDRQYLSLDGRWVPSTVDIYVEEIQKGSLTYELAIVDTPGDGDGDYERLRPLSYTQADVFLVCFSVASPSTFDAVPEKWIPEVRHHYPDATIILVGTHVDERVETPPEVDAAEHERKFITKEDGERMAKRVGAKKYVECNATHTAGLKAILYEALNAVIEPGKPRKQKRYLQPGWPWYWCCWMIIAAPWLLAKDHFKAKRGGS